MTDLGNNQQTSALLSDSDDGGSTTPYTLSSAAASVRGGWQMKVHNSHRGQTLSSRDTYPRPRGGWVNFLPPNWYHEKPTASLCCRDVMCDWASRDSWPSCTHRDLTSCPTHSRQWAAPVTSSCELQSRPSTKNKQTKQNPLRWRWYFFLSKFKF